IIAPPAPGVNGSTAPARRAAGVALAARPAAHQRQLAALRARVALVTLQAGLANLLRLAGGPHRLRRRGAAGGVAVAVVAAGLLGVQMAAARCLERLGRRRHGRLVGFLLFLLAV